jgi:FGGY-family pentulose kinase
MAESPVIVGLDVGTQSVRAALVDLKGRTIAFGVAAIDTVYPRPAWAEQSPGQWWEASAAAIRQAIERAGIGKEAIAGIGLDCTACTVVACREDGTPVRPALLWMDQRSSREAAELSETGDAVLRYVSGKLSPEWMLPKALWIKRNEPENYAKADRIIEGTNWLVHEMTGEWSLSLNHCAVKWNYARPVGGWPREMMASVGLEDLAAKWPERIEPMGARAGALTARAAEHLGLPVGLPVAQGGIDAYLGMIGMGATLAGDVAVIVGSSTCHLAQSSGGVFGSGAAGCYPDATVEGLYTIEAGQTATGAVLDWYRRHFGAREEEAAKARGVSVYQVLDELASAVPPGCEGVVAREDFQGNRSPFKNPAARGAITGLSLSHGPGHIFRALYEATACGTRQILDDLEAHGLGIERVIFGGGGVKSALWLQIHADLLQRPITLPREGESCALGSAMTAAVAAGLVPDLDAAAREMVATERVVEPDGGDAGAYEEVHAKYQGLYRRLND